MNNIQNAPSGTIRAALRYPAFRWLLSALAVSQIGDWLYNLALVVLVYDRIHSTAWAGVTTAARIVPIVVLGPLGGVVADRFDRRRVMIGCDVARMVLMMLLAAIAAARLPILLAPVIAGMATAAAAPYLPCVSAVTPRIVDDADLPGANAARSAVTGIGVVTRAGARRRAAAPGVSRTRLRAECPDLRALSSWRPGGRRRDRIPALALAWPPR